MRKKKTERPVGTRFSPCPFSAKERGFTLLEVLVAVAILGVGIVIAMQLFGGSMNAVSKADRYVKAVFLAKGIVDESFSADVELGETEGVFEEPFDVFEWKKTVTAYERKEKTDSDLLGGLTVKLAEVDVNVSYSGPDEGKARSLVELKTLRVYFEEEKGGD